MSKNKTQYLNADAELEEIPAGTKTKKKKNKNKPNKAANTVKHVFGVIGTTLLRDRKSVV